MATTQGLEVITCIMWSVLLVNKVASCKFSNNQSYKQVASLIQTSSYTTIVVLSVSIPNSLCAKQLPQWRYLQ